MTLEVVRAMLAWCTVFDIGVAILWVAIFTLAHDWMYKVHTKWFKMSVETFDAIHYAGMAAIRIGVVLFNLVPYLALRIVG